MRHKRQASPSVSRHHLTKQGEIDDAIVVVEEDGLAPVAAGVVAHRVRGFIARLARHEHKRRGTTNFAPTVDQPFAQGGLSPLTEALL